MGGWLKGAECRQTAAQAATIHLRVEDEIDMLGNVDL